jgi:hypothetical protein
MTFFLLSLFLSFNVSAKVLFMGRLSDAEFEEQQKNMENVTGDNEYACDAGVYGQKCEEPKIGVGASCGGLYKECKCPTDRLSTPTDA